jgi:hypothetical protein
MLKNVATVTVHRKTMEIANVKVTKQNTVVQENIALSLVISHHCASTPTESCQTKIVCVVTN